MGWQDRPYAHSGYRYQGGGFSLGLPSPTRVVKYLILINIAIFVIQSLSAGLLERGFALISGIGGIIQFWRLVSYQFLHGDVFHLLFNMLGLYFFGPPIERLLGPVRFLLFYLICGIVGGLVFVVLGAVSVGRAYLIGASGSVLGLLAACAVLFPSMMIILVFFPLPIRAAAAILALIYGLNVISSGNLSDACHFGGMAAGFIYAYYKPFFDRFTIVAQTKRWESNFQRQVRDQEELDRLLEKIHKQGIHSLSWYEKWKLKRITERQRRER